MPAHALPPDLPQQLLGLARLGDEADLDMRQVLLRVTTDLFVSRAEHSFEEIRQFETIALGFIAKTDAATRRIIAEKLSRFGATPLLLAERLVAEGGPAAAVMLERSTLLSRAWRVASAIGPETELAVAVARRGDLDPALCSLLVARPEIDVARALATNLLAPLNPPRLRALIARARNDRELGTALCGRVSDAHEIAPLFLYASHSQRMAILMDARRADLGATRSGPSTVEATTAAEIENAAVKKDFALLESIIARALGAPLEMARRIIGDQRGEAMALTLCALHVSPDAAARIFMSLDAPIALNLDRIRDLSALVGELRAATARRLVDAMTDRDLPITRTRVHAPATDPTAASIPSRGLDTSRMVARPRRPGLLFVKRKA